jgi:hypothetical protein
MNPIISRPASHRLANRVIRFRLRVTGSLIAIMFLAACGSSGTAPGADQITAAPEVPAEATPATASGVNFPAKPGSPIGLHYEVSGTPRIGQPLQIKVTIQAAVTVSGLTIEAAGDERLFVSPGSASIRVALMAAGQPMVHMISVAPQVEGSLRLHVLVQGEINGQVQANNITVPIRVGPSDSEGQQMSDRVTTDEAGEAIISLPAREN